MRVERRYQQTGRGLVLRGLCLIVEGEGESETLDEAFGTHVGKDGLIGTLPCECRLSDGHGPHYLYIPTNAEPAALETAEREAT